MRAQETVTSKPDWVSCCASSGTQQVMPLPLFRLRSSSHVLVRLIPIRKQIECWGKLYDPPQSLKRSCCGANLLGTRGSVEDVIARALRLGGGVDDELTVIAELPEPSRDVRRGIVDRVILDSGDPA